MKAISYSLFGNNPVYTTGAIRNAELAATVYPGWTCIFYASKSLPKAIADSIKKAGGVIRFGDEAIKNELFWRFLVAADPNVDRYLIRDTDSRLSKREADTVAEWEASGLTFHSIRDHPHHTLPLGGGLWGGTRGAISDMKQFILSSGLADQPFIRQTSYGLDQTFLSRHVWPIAKQSYMAHDSCNRRIYPTSLPFPAGCKFGDWRFCGEVVDERDQPHPIQWQHRINHMTP